MLVLHGLWLPGGRLAVWGEDSALPARPPRRPGRPPRHRPHPFAAGPEALAAALGPVATGGDPGTALLALPSRGGAPTESPELIRPVPEPEPDRPAPPTVGPVTDRVPWRVPTLTYDVDHAFAMLTLGDGRQLADGVVRGATLTHLDEVARFALDLVRRGRVLPGVRWDGSDPGDPAGGDPFPGDPVAHAAAGDGRKITGHACWRPVLTGGDAAWARALARALPPAVAAAGTHPFETADGGDPRSRRALPDELLERLTDAAARAVLTDLELAPAGRQRGTPVAVRDWLRALTGRRRTFTAAPAVAAELRRELDGWQRDATGGPVRACFQLVEPPDDHAPSAWRVEFALQAVDEPGPVVGADRIWAAPDGLRALDPHLDTPQETLLAELGRATRLWPGLAAALRTATPEALSLDATGAHAFLREAAPALHAAGFGVLLPSWWRRPSARLGARLRARSRTAPGRVAARSTLGTASLVDYRWEVALGDERLTADELRELAELRTPLVRLRGRWIELEPRALAAGLRLLDSGGAMTVADLLRTGLAAGDTDEELPVTGINVDGALGDLLAGDADRRLTPLPAPAGFTGALRPYQERGLAWLAFLESLGLGGILADDMGLGKTVQLLALLAGDPPETGPTLLVCPMSLVGNWQREAARFAPALRVHVHHGAERVRGAEFATAVRAADLVLTTYPLVARDAAALADVDWHRVVLDEAQAIRNAATRQAGAVRSLPARHRIAVTGTPVENRLADLWSIMEFANPGLLGPAATFRRRYAEPVERHGDERAAARLRRVTGPFVLRRVKTDPTVIGDLPEKLEMEVLCNLTAEQATLYQAVVDDMLDRIERSSGVERRGLVLATMTRLKQVCNHPAHFLRDGSGLPGRSGKLARLEEILDEVRAAREKALIFTQYAEFGGMLRAHLAARLGRGDIACLHGGVDRADREEMVARFTDADGPPVFVLSLKAGGTGLNLTAANHVVHVDRWWNPAVEDQATDRAYRIGQRRAVQVRKLVCAGTVEEKVAAMIADKRELAASVVGGGEQWLTELSTAELRRIFTLEAGAVVE